MSSYVDTTRKRNVRVWTVALLLLVVALLIPQLTWADHGSDHPYSQFDDPSFVSPSGADADSARWAALGAYYANTGATSLAENPEVGVFLRGSAALQPEVAAAASSARWAALGAYYTSMGAAFLAANPEVAAYQRFAAGAAQQTGATFLAANPEIMTHQRFVQDGCHELGQVC